MSYKTRWPGCRWAAAGVSCCSIRSGPRRRPCWRPSATRSRRSAGATCAEDVGASAADMVAIAERTRMSRAAGGRGRRGRVSRAVTAFVSTSASRPPWLTTGERYARGVRVALQGAGSVGGGVARDCWRARRAADRADRRCRQGPGAGGGSRGEAVSAEDLRTPCEVFSPNALGAILDDAGIAGLDCAIRRRRSEHQLAGAARRGSRGVAEIL